MNAFKSAFRLSKTNQLQPLFEDVKSWDEARARFLQTHLKIVHLVMDALDKKIIQVQKYIDGLDKLMSARIQQITSYCKNGVNDSEFFLVPSSLNSLKPCHLLLKHLLMQQSQRELNLSKKGSLLSIILEKLKKLKSDQCSQSEQQREGDVIRQIKSSIRYLIDCQLPDLIIEVIGACKEVTVAFSQQRNFYLSVQKFVRGADKQLKMHQQISQQLLKLVQSFSKRQKQLRQKLRQILLQWIKQDFQDKIFHEQLSKNCSDDLVNEYYDIQNLIPEQNSLWGGQSLAAYLENFNILPFREHQRLAVYSRQVFYNGKIDAKIIITQMKEVYLFRILANQPDFSFTLSKNVKLKKKSPLILKVSQTHKTLLLRQEIDFEFTLEFNLESDLKQFQGKSVSLGCQLESK